MRAIITVGLGFGDEGKGATVDFLTRFNSAELVVRYCGGAQAGHNVQLPDGRRHTFSQFGSGTFAGAKTYLGPRMIISPTTMVPEADHLRSLGISDPWSRLSVHPQCLVATGYHAAMNRLRECARGENRHGSCGLGIGETRQYWLRYGHDAIFAGDLVDPSTLGWKLALMRDRFLLEMQELPRIDARSSALVRDSTPLQEADLLRHCGDKLTISDRLPAAETVVFEGAQGVLLDEWKGFHPYTTWSTVTPQHALEILAEYSPTETTILGITRAYATRHGAGPFPSECPRMSAAMSDDGNPRNDWQGAIRFGPLDLVLTEYAARVAKVDGIVVNGLDELPKRARVVTQYSNCERLEEPNSLRQQERLTELLRSVVPVEASTGRDGILQRLGSIAPILGTSHGPTHQDREFRRD